MNCRALSTSVQYTSKPGSLLVSFGIDACKTSFNEHFAFFSDAIAISCNQWRGVFSKTFTDCAEPSVARHSCNCARTQFRTGDCNNIGETSPWICTKDSSSCVS